MLDDRESTTTPRPDPELIARAADHPDFDRHESVSWFAPGGVTMIIAVHSTALGPALGGARWYPYRRAVDALGDVLRLSRAMTYKAALAGLDLGGGKAVIVGGRGHDDSGVLRAFGRSIDAMGGRYITAPDVGTGEADMNAIAEETRHVVGVSATRGGTGDPSLSTAVGVLRSMQAALAPARGRVAGDDLSGRRVVVSGAGKVGGHLIDLLVAAGANTFVSDVDPDAVASVLRRHPAVTSVAPEHAHRTPADVFAPCALGGVLDEGTIAELDCEVVVGAANNPLARADGAEQLGERDITYIPDFVANAGGLIQMAGEHRGEDAEAIGRRVEGIGATVEALLRRAASTGELPLAAAESLGRERIAGGSQVR